MKVLIAGSGTTGGLIGARLIERGVDVTFCTRPERKAQLMTTGLTLSSPYGRFRRPACAITPDEIDTQFAVVIIACRAHRYGDTVSAVQMAFAPDTIVVPILEGADHLQAELIHGGHLIAGRLEARIDIDADGFLMQRGPVAELKLGACDPLDAGRAEWLAHLLAGRGIKTRVEPQIGDAIWERYAFTAAAVAINTISGSSLRDAIRPTNTITSFDRLMAEGTDVGQKIGLRPRPEQVISYRKAFRLQTRPVQPPALITDGGARADEAAYLLIEMVEIATRASVFETQQRERSANADARQIPHHIVRMEASEDLAMVLLGIRLGRGRTKPLPGRKRPKHPVSRRMPARRAARDTDPDDFVRQLR